MNSLESTSNIIEILNENLNFAKDLEDLLLKEKSVLETNDIEKFEEIIAIKPTFIQNLESSQNKLFNALKNLGYTDTDDDFLNFFNDQCSKLQESIRTLCSTLKETMHKLKNLAIVNNTIVQVNHSQVSAVLNILLNNDENITYDNKANTKNSSNGRHITKA